MARGPRRRRGAPDHGATRADDDVDLGAPEHAWWAQQDLSAPPERASTGPAPVAEPAAPVEEPRDILAEHFGADWRTSFGFERSGPPASPHPPTPEPPTPEPPTPEPDAEEVVEPEVPIDTSDPYAVLGVEPSASWEEIVGAHRALARRHHPDRLLDRPAVEREAAERRIRDINVAYGELRVRRGK